MKNFSAYYNLSAKHSFFKEVISIKTFLVVDGHSIAHRGFHALGHAHLTAPDGTPTTMIVGFLNMLFKVQDALKPDCTIIVFDAGGETFRHEIYSEYKANRKPLADELRIQLPILQELLKFLGYNVILRSGVEADDVAASIARLLQHNGHEVILLSSDKDLLQLVGTGVKMMRPVKNGISGAEMYDAKLFVKEFGFSPSSMADYLALTGDKSDNVKGIAGIGEISAKKILSQYPTLEKIFAAVDELPNGIRKKFEASSLEQVTWIRDHIIRLKEDIFSGNNDFISECVNFMPDLTKAEELSATLGLKRVLERIGSNMTIIPRKIEAVGKFRMPKSEIIIDDYKNTLRENPELFASCESIWDLKTAYYLLHPDTTGKMFPEIMTLIKQADNPAEKLAEFSGGLEGEIYSYENLHDVMTKIDLPLIPVLNNMEDHGIRINHEKFCAVQDELEAQIMQIEAEIIRQTGVRINVNSPQQVSWLLFERLGFVPESKTRGKTSYSTDAGVLERLAKLPDGKIPALILEHRELSKMLSGFVIPLQRAAGHDGIIHTTFEPAFTGTGRLSSRDPNLQNIPAFGVWAEKIKSGLVPVNPENVFVSADYSQIELRVLAHLSGEERLIDAFRNHRDIHSETASWVFGVMPEFVTPELRRTAKMINFGLLYGMSAFGLAERLSVSRSEARDIVNKYFAALPGVKNFLDGIVIEAKSRNFARTFFGRIRPVNEIPAKSTALDRALINTPIQGSAADIARMAMINFARERRGELFLQVHDSLVCECPENQSDEISDIMCEIMRTSGGNITDLEVEAKRGKSLADV